MGLHGFADGNHIRFRHMAEILLQYPDANPCMALREKDHRVQTCCLEGRSEEKRGIEAGGKTLAYYAAWPPDLLALALEGRRRLGIGKPEAGNGGPDGARKQVGAARIGRLVSIHRAVVAPGFQQTCGILQDTVHCGIVRRDESGKDLRHVGYAAPLVVRQKFYPALLDNRSMPMRLHAEFEFADFGFVEAFQPFDIQQSGDIAHREMGPRGDAVDGPGLLANDGRRGPESDPYVGKRFVGRVLDRDFFDNRNTVLRRSEIDPPQGSVLQRYRFGFLLPDRRFNSIVIVRQFHPPAFTVRHAAMVSSDKQRRFDSPPPVAPCTRGPRGVKIMVP